MSDNPNLTTLFIQALGMSRVVAGEQAVVLADRQRANDPCVAAACAALEALGARALTLILPDSHVAALPGEQSTDPLNGQPAAVECLQQADFVVDLTSNGIIHSRHRAAIQQTGARILTVMEPPGTLARMLPTPELRQLARDQAGLLGKTRTFHVTSSAGTDFEVQLGNHPEGMQYGAADEPGRWDHWPSTMVVRYPDDGSAQGRIVLDRGDILLPLNRYVAEPVTLEIENGRIETIAGDGLDAELLRNYFAAWNDDAVYATSHVGWGLDPRAQWSAMAMPGGDTTIGMDARCFAGNFMWSTGPNHFVGRETPCHLDIPMRNCTIALDGKEVVHQGKLCA